MITVNDTLTDEIKALRKLLNACGRAYDFKVMADNNCNIEGWKDKFEKSFQNLKEYQSELRKLEKAVIFDLVENQPCEDNTPHCPYCSSCNLKQDGECIRCHHHSRSVECMSCRRKFTRHWTKGIFEGGKQNTWYVDCDGEVIKGMPSCYEHYIYTCKFCKGDVLKEFRQMDGVLLLETVKYKSPTGEEREISSLCYTEDGPQQRCFYKCKDCLKEIEYLPEYWTLGA